MRILLWAWIIPCLALASSPQPSYYRLQNTDAPYKKLEDAPLQQKELKDLKPSATQKPLPRPKSTKQEPDSSRRAIAPNTQALNRAQRSEYMRYGNYLARDSHKRHFFLFGANLGADIFTVDKAKKASLEFSAKLGYHYQFSHAFRIYANLGYLAPTSRAIPHIFSANLNADFLLNVVYFDLFFGIGYGGEYLAKYATLSHGAIINLGASKSFGFHQIEAGIRVPFYAFLEREGRSLYHNIDIILSYNYKF